MAILIFQHSDLSTPGRLGLTLRDHGLSTRIVRPDRGEPIPPDLDNVDGIVSLGGPQNMDEHKAEPGRWPWIEHEMRLMREAHARQMPLVGLCLGSQMMAVALGGEVQPMPAPEMGFHEWTILPAGQTDTVLSGIAWSSPTFQVHGREVAKLPPGAALLGSTKACKAQAWRAGMRSYGFQFHFECDRASIDRFAEADKDDFRRAGLGVDDVKRQADKHYAAYARLADRLCLNIAQYLFPPQMRGATGRDMPKGSASVTLVG